MKPKHVLYDGRYPDSLVELVTRDELGYAFLRWETVPLDPWGNAYVYVPPAAGGSTPIVRCLGSDGKPGGDGDAADIDRRLPSTREG